MLIRIEREGWVASGKVKDILMLTNILVAHQSLFQLDKLW